jgi:hypothetical protein
MAIKNSLTFLAGLALFMLMSDAGAWTLVYANDATGKLTYGNLIALREAAKQGANIKVSLNDASVMPCQELAIGADYVTCLYTTGISTDYVSPGTTFGFQDDAYYGYYMLNTKGQVAISRWSVGEHVDKGKTLFTRAIKWFVE